MTILEQFSQQLALSLNSFISINWKSVFRQIKVTNKHYSMII